MPAAVLFRGHAFRTPRDGFSCRDWGVDYRLCIDSHRRHLLDPLRDRYGAVDVFLVTYHDPPTWDHLHRDYAPRVAVLSPGGSSQRQTFLRGLDAILDVQKGTGDYDLVATCRFDIELLSAPTLHPGFDPSKINFLFREWKEECWKDRRIADCMHFLPGGFLDDFRCGVAETQSDICLHTIYRPVERRVGEDRINVILGESIHDSNTDMPGVPNPFYRMVRVR